MSIQYEVTTIGNAIVDVIATATDEFLNTHKIIKGAMNMIEADRARELYTALGQNKHEVSGGSAANSMAGFASLGGTGAFIGKVADDDLGRFFTSDMRASGVYFNTTPLKDGPETARSMIVVTPDAQRSMNTYLGASVEFYDTDVDADLIKQSALIYLEGYLFDKEPAKRAYRKASDIALQHGAKVSLTLSDSFCVERHRQDFLKLIDTTDILFANDREMLSMYETTDLDAAIEAVRGKCEVVIVTMGEKGSVIVTAKETIPIKAHPVAQLVDTTGAGDQYAAGFLFGYARKMPLATCGALGSLAASEVISHIGPRPAVSLKDLAKKELGLPL